MSKKTNSPAVPELNDKAPSISKDRLGSDSCGIKRTSSGAMHNSKEVIAKRYFQPRYCTTRLPITGSSPNPSDTEEKMNDIDFPRRLNGT